MVDAGLFETPVDEDDTHLVEHGPISYDDRIVPILEDIRRAPLQENDAVILLSGRPGVGKTKLGMDICAYLDPLFGIGQVVFDHEKLIEVALRLGPGRAILWDESREGTLSSAALSQTNQRVGLFLDTVRSRCLFIVLIQPSFWNYQMQIATERSDCLFHVYKKSRKDYDRNNPIDIPFARGYYNFFGFPAKKLTYIKGKKYHSFSKNVKPDLKGLRFGNRWVVDKKEYQKLKDEAVVRMNEAAEATQTRGEMAKDTRVNVLRLKYLKSFKKNWPSLSLETFAALSGENRKVLLLTMDYECKKMYDI